MKRPDSKVHRANMGPTWVLSAPDGPHVGPMNLAIKVVNVAARLSIIHSVTEATVGLDDTTAYPSEA